MRRLLGYLSLIIALGGGLTYFVLIDHYARTLPRIPQPQSGQVIAMDDHGTRVFLTATQQRILWGVQLGAVIIGVFGGMLLVRGNRNEKG